MRSLFLHDPSDLDALIPGGVQLCSHEFLDIVRAASAEVRLVPVTVSRAPLWRVRRRFGLGSYLLYNPAEARTKLAAAIADFAPTHAYLNRSELIRLAPLITQLSPGTKVIVMSHGNQSGDDLYEVGGPGGRRSNGLSRLKGGFQLGMDLVTESEFRHRHLDGVCVMSVEEEIIERWLGATRTVVLPRIIRPRPLEWHPVGGRVGFVGTLNHTPNRIALERLCAQLASSGDSPNLRLVGGPEATGRSLAEKYPFVTYLGRLDDVRLHEEAATWSLFLNPVFWLSRGASMKLGQALAWALPTLTTRAGMRGYELSPDQAFIAEDSVEDFSGKLLRLLRDDATLAGLRDRLLSTSWSTADCLAKRLKSRFS